MPSFPRPLALLGHAGRVGLALGAVEVAIRVSPLHGFSPANVGQLLVESMSFAALVSVLFALPLLRVSWRPFGVHLGLVIGLYAAANYRFEIVLNEFVRDPKVWAGGSAVFLAGLASGLPLDRLVATGGAARRPVSIGLFLLLLLGSGTAFLRARPVLGHPGDRPSIVVISLDTTRMDRLGAYGHPIHTPTLDKLAREGAVFTEAIAAAPITEPSHLAMFTGIAPFRSGIVSNGTDLGDRPALLWRTLHENGYTTGGFVAGFPLHGKYGWNQGFDVFDDDFGTTPGLELLTLKKAWNQVAIKEHALRERSAELVNARAVPWIQANHGNEYFAFVHFYDVHGPYTAPGNKELGPPPTEGTPLTLPPYWPARDRAITSPEWLARAYDKEIEAIDGAVQQIVDAIGPDLDRTILIVTADHGESLTEHDYLFDHGDDLYDPSLRVPFIVRYPPRVKAGTRIDCQVGGVDLTPTLLALVGIPDSLPRDGISRVPALEDGTCEATPVIASTTSGRFVAIPPVSHALRVPSEKIIVHDDKDAELYDLGTDPGEETNLAPSGRAREAEAALHAILATGGKAQSMSGDAETRAMLEQLGYLEPSGETPASGGGTP